MHDEKQCFSLKKQILVEKTNPFTLTKGYNGHLIIKSNLKQRMVVMVDGFETGQKDPRIAAVGRALCRRLWSLPL